jgi:hypothetical protein
VNKIGEIYSLSYEYPISGILLYDYTPITLQWGPAIRILVYLLNRIYNQKGVALVFDNTIHLSFVLYCLQNRLDRTYGKPCFRLRTELRVTI